MTPTTRAHRIVFRNLTLLVAFILAVCLSAFYGFNWMMRQHVAVSLLNQGATKAEKELVRFFQNGEHVLRIITKWAENNTLNDGSHERLDNWFVPVLEEFPTFHTLLIADQQGSYYKLNHTGRDWVSSAFIQPHPDKLVSSRKWSDTDPAPQITRETSAYDLRARPWFQEAWQTPANVPTWVAPYPFWNTGQMGVTGMIRWQNQTTNMVCALDILLQDIIAFVDALALAPGARVFLLEREQNSFAVLGEPDQAASPKASISLALSEWEKRGWAVDSPFPVQYGGETLWAGFHPLATKISVFYLGVLIPERAIVGATADRQWLLFTLIGAILITGLAAGWKMTKPYITHGGFSAAGARPTADQLKALVEKGEGPEVEFKSTMRMNLATGKPGKEIEISWLKAIVAFLNSQGGTLLIGVNDKGEFLGLSSDSFHNDDKCLLHCKNLIHQHIGPEYSKYIQFGIYQVDGQTLVVVHCSKALDPVFLKVNKDEEFYIRSGPSNIRLTTGQVIRHLKSSK